MSGDLEKAPLLSFPNTRKQKHVLVIHGGAGTIDKAKMTPELRVEYTAALRKALEEGNKILSTGGEALDAVVAAVSAMEGNQALKFYIWSHCH